MSSLPEELWNLILEIGIISGCLTYKDLCCVSISSRGLHRLSSENSLWNHLITRDFYSPPHPPPLSSLPPPSSHSYKSHYKSRFEAIQEEQAVFISYQQEEQAVFIASQQRGQAVFLASTRSSSFTCTTISFAASNFL